MSERMTSWPSARCRLLIRAAASVETDGQALIEVSCARDGGGIPRRPDARHAVILAKRVGETVGREDAQGVGRRIEEEELRVEWCSEEDRDERKGDLDGD